MLAPALRSEISAGGGAGSVVVTQSDMTLGSSSVVIGKNPNSHDLLNITLPSASQNICKTYKIAARDRELRVKSASSELEGFDYGLISPGTSAEFSSSNGEWFITSGYINGGIDGKVKDIYPGSVSGLLSNHHATYATYRLNGRFIFPAIGPNGIELWRSDGTENGTVQIKDINPVGSSDPQQFTVRSDEIAGASNSFYFTATDGNNGAELWKE